ncbi:putative RNA methyltransferase [Dissulfurispira thermophila]|uniref:23S rRNA (Uracil(1939)-C(5))-methyltransferase RlmD n=2 Tax=root TaxID=1 RepID=A0A5J4KZT4_9ZZZZ|nr:class I SAM-dependent RNA methyltransferase [Dissulfurispira thermophila]BCB97340.1 putative RNA methyltransferase [Dissulfurispira thermophila]
MKAENKVITLKAELPAYGGFSIGRCNGKIVFIKNSIPGETIEARLEEKGDYYNASTIKILEPSPDRVKPDCKFFGICGGCQLQYISYPRQIVLKEKVLKDSLKRIGKINMQLSESLFDSNPFYYRHRGQFKVSNGKIGFYKKKTTEVVEIDNCLLMIDEINEYLLKAHNILKNRQYAAVIREMHISCKDKVVVLIKVRANHLLKWDKLASELMQEGFHGVFIDSGRRLFKYGRHYITFDLEDLKYTISPMSFFQSHWRLNQKVVRFIRDNLQPFDGKRILDLYSGAGNFSLPIAHEAGEVIAVEENPFAIEDGKRNLQINGIKGYRFILSSIENLNIKESVDILILDPPRSGLTNAAIYKILAMAPKKIAYISCNPATFARDLRKLLAGYELQSIRMIDFFPHTYHIESLAFLRMK